MPERTPGKRGRRPAVFPVGLDTIDRYLEAPLPPATLPIDVSGGYDAWGMLGNDQYGDCGFAGMVHKMMADAAHEGEVPPPITSEQVIASYLAYDHGQDDGVIVSEMMSAWYETGFFGSKIVGYAPVPLGEVDSAMQVFGAVILGVYLTDDADQLFNEGQPWTVGQGQTPDHNEGHVIVKVKSDPTMDTFITWGAEQQAYKAWSAACIEEAWVPITPEMAQKWSLSLEQLEADIAALHGTVPSTPPPAPPPAPTPGPKPSPAPTLIREFIDWLESLI